MRLAIFLLIAVAGFALAGCNRPESPAEVRQDVANAQAEAQRDLADAQADARKNMADAQKDVADAAAGADPAAMADASQDASQAATASEFKVAVAQAAANHKVAIEKCEAFSGAVQKGCKDRADGDLDTARRQAEQRRDGTG